MPMVLPTYKIEVWDSSASGRQGAWQKINVVRETTLAVTIVFHLPVVIFIS